ncbi:MAG: DUF4388 domain-containing protein [Thermogemmatispora sp.]|jgi:hypothetical protein|uniref:PatA-like N-terminal domain-containing protein n=1 Tax=Thermogemmatispora aurantia TaxID=2045279 RepID=A0A5J4K8B7_9CHLR|nr:MULTISPECIES: DUF4388 domain-containing protein [Thermogemmatispora]MBE3567859.1 DUF4388 domain-containing protein [Thermogemmatispora sp.]GER82949.1 hypothetical protein KTAU_15860 [Thermogemmatispora aurantia]
MVHLPRLCYHRLTVAADIRLNGERRADIIGQSEAPMPQQRQTVTNRLADVIEVVQLGRKTGLLTVERGEGTALEEGAITFVNGQPVQARLGPHSGAEALRRLKLWGPCRFAFVPFSPPSSPLPPLLDGHATPGSLPALPQRQGTDPRLRRTPAPSPSGPLGSLSFPGSGTGPDTGPRITPPLPPRQTEPRPDRRVPLPGSGTFSRTPSRVPLYDDALQRLEQLGFSRAHRRLYLLIDGTRTPAELARLMGRSEEEVLRLLSDLEHAGFVAPSS